MSSTSCSGTPRTEHRSSHPARVEQALSLPNKPDTDYDYDERELGAAPQQARPVSTPRIGPSYQNALQARSSYSSPISAAPHFSSFSPYESQQKNSWEVQSQRTYRHGSAPPGHPLWRQGTLYHQDSFHGDYPDHESEAIPVNDHYWYAGAPPSASLSQAYQSPPSMATESATGIFGVMAPHHHPGRAHSSRAGETMPSLPPWSRSWHDGQKPTQESVQSSRSSHPGQTRWELGSLGRNEASGPYGHVYGQPRMSDSVKEERMRMLEKELGAAKVSMKPGQEERNEYDDEDDLGDDEALALGSVTGKGRLITERPKWKRALRILLGITTVAGCACGLGGALLIKTSSSTAAPAPKGTAPAYVLYACSVVTLLLLFYLFIVRACRCNPLRKELNAGSDPGNILDGMVIPVLSNGGIGGKRGRKGKYGRRGMQPQGAPTVNFIVDPSFLGMGRRESRSNKDDSEDDERLPGDARRSRKRKNGLGVVGNMRMQRRWQLARRELKVVAIWDVVLCLLWIACDVISLGLGKKCTISGGWCEFYNAAIASGVIVVAVLLGTIYLDYRDLKVSRLSPKPPI